MAAMVVQNPDLGCLSDVAHEEVWDILCDLLRFMSWGLIVSAQQEKSRFLVQDQFEWGAVLNPVLKYVTY